MQEEKGIVRMSGILKELDDLLGSMKNIDSKIQTEGIHRKDIEKLSTEDLQRGIQNLKQSQDIMSSISLRVKEAIGLQVSFGLLVGTEIESRSLINSLDAYLYQINSHIRGLEDIHKQRGIRK